MKKSKRSLGSKDRKDSEARECAGDCFGRPQRICQTLLKLLPYAFMFLFFFCFMHSAVS